jgi:hypothetical protein
VSPSGDAFQDSARLGATALPGIGLTRASWSPFSTMKAVPIVVSAGSK